MADLRPMPPMHKRDIPCRLQPSVLPKESLRPQRNFACALSALLLTLGAIAHAQGGPPFRTDDPETPGNHRWEVNFGWMADRNPGAGAYSLPDFDINYGWGDRIQLKYELPVDMHEARPGAGSTSSVAAATQAHLDTGFGDSLLGFKWRFYQHESKSHAGSENDSEASETDFSVSVYPQVSLHDPPGSLQHDSMLPDPELLLPFEMNARVGPIRLNGETGYWFTNGKVPQSWIRGLIVSHEFPSRTEACIELYDQQDANRIDGAPKRREATLGLGGRHALNRRETVLLLLMGGRSFQSVSSANSQPSWIAYAGIQLLFGRQERPAR